MHLDAALRQLIAHNLSSFELREARSDGHRAAAVALTLVEEGWGAQLEGIQAPSSWSTEASLVLTRRAAGLNSHPGQWALPGGKMDPGENAEQAALRELHEEIGLKLGNEAVLGRLDDFVTRSGFVITPVIVWAGRAPELTPNPGEVASIHRIPVQEFMRSDAPILEPMEDSDHPVLLMPVGQSWIAAPTAALLYQFREVCIAGRHIRVAHFEQPMFARR